MLSSELTRIEVRRSRERRRVTEDVSSRKLSTILRSEGRRLSLLSLLLKLTENVDRRGNVVLEERRLSSVLMLLLVGEELLESRGSGSGKRSSPRVESGSSWSVDCTTS